MTEGVCGTRRVRVADVIRATEQFYGLDRGSLASPRRLQKLAKPRHIVCWLARKRCGVSYPQIGTFLGGRDHTTVLNSMERVAFMIETEPEIVKDIEAIWVAALEMASPKARSAPLAPVAPAPVPTPTPSPESRRSARVAALRQYMDRLGRSRRARVQFSPEWYAINNTRFALGFSEAFSGGAA